MSSTLNKLDGKYSIIYEGENYSLKNIQHGSGAQGKMRSFTDKNRKEYVIKIVEPKDEKAKNRFEREIEILKKINSKFSDPQVPKIIDSNIENEILYYVMPKYTPLRAVKWDEKSPITRIKLLKGLIEFLSELHELEIYHRDIKFQNTLFDESLDRLILCDFGISYDGACENHYTEDGEYPGNKYLLPELQSNQISLKNNKQLYKIDSMLSAVLIWATMIGKDYGDNNQKRLNKKYDPLNPLFNKGFYNKKNGNYNTLNTGINKLLTKCINDNISEILEVKDIVIELKNILDFEGNGVIKDKIFLGPDYLPEIHQLITNCKPSKHRLNIEDYNFEKSNTLKIVENSSEEWELVSDDVTISENTTYEASIFSIEFNEQELLLEFKAFDDNGNDLHFKMKYKINKEIKSIIDSIHFN